MMKAMRWAFVLAVSSWLLPGAGLSGPPARGGGKRPVAVVLVQGHGTGGQLFSNVVGYVRQQLPVEVRVRACTNELAKLPAEKQLDVLGALCRADELFTVALVVEEKGIRERILLRREKKAGIVNLKRLALEVRNPSVLSKDWRVLVHKETMRTIGYLAGLKECLNPQCAMSAYKNVSIRHMGRNYCPPCQRTFDEALGIDRNAPEWRRPGGKKRPSTGKPKKRPSPRDKE